MWGICPPQDPWISGRTIVSGKGRRLSTISPMERRYGFGDIALFFQTRSPCYRHIGSRPMVQTRLARLQGIRGSRTSPTHNSSIRTPRGIGQLNEKPIRTISRADIGRCTEWKCTRSRDRTGRPALGSGEAAMIEFHAWGRLIGGCLRSQPFIQRLPMPQPLVSSLPATSNAAALCRQLTGIMEP